MQIEHFAIWTADLERLRAFYEGYFGAQATTRYFNPKKSFTSYFLIFADGARLELMQKPTVQPLDRTADSEWLGYAHLAFAAGSTAAVDALTAQLRAAGYTAVDGPRWTGDGYYESCVLDPDGNRVEITV